MSQIPNAVESDVDAWVGVHHGPPLVQCADCGEWGGRHAWICPPLIAPETKRMWTENAFVSKPLTFEGIASLVRRMEERAAEDAAMYGIDLSGLPSILDVDACYECGCIGCSTGCKAGGRER